MKASITTLLLSLPSISPTPLPDFVCVRERERERGCGGRGGGEERDTMIGGIGGTAAVFGSLKKIVNVSGENGNTVSSC